MIPPPAHRPRAQADDAAGDDRQLELHLRVGDVLRILRRVDAAVVDLAGGGQIAFSTSSSFVARDLEIDIGIVLTLALVFDPRDDDSGLVFPKRLQQLLIRRIDIGAGDAAIVHLARLKRRERNDLHVESALGAGDVVGVGVLRDRESSDFAGCARPSTGSSRRRRL